LALRKPSYEKKDESAVAALVHFGDELRPAEAAAKPGAAQLGHDQRKEVAGVEIVIVIAFTTAAPWPTGRRGKPRRPCGSVTASKRWLVCD
jgi:hypothetical protein